MADHTHIEWADATSERRGALRRKECRPGQGQAINQLHLRRTTLRGEPIPDISRSLAAIAARAGGHDVRGFSTAASGDRHDVIPCRAGGIAVRAAPIERLHDQRCRFRRDSVNTTATARGSASSAVSKLRIRRVSRPRVLVCARSTQPGPYGGSQPCLTAPTPCQAGCALPPTLADSWARRRASRSSAPRTHISTAIVARSVHHERVDRAVLPTAGAHLRSIRAAREIAPVGGTAILGGSHAL